MVKYERVSLLNNHDILMKHKTIRIKLKKIKKRRLRSPSCYVTFLYHSLLSEHHKNATKKSAAVVKISRKKKRKKKKSRGHSIKRKVSIWAAVKTSFARRI